MIKLRDYQVKIIDKARAVFLAGKRRIILQAPCGFGKTIASAEITRSATSKGKKILFLCHRRELCYQAKDRFSDYGIDSGLIMAGEEPDLSQDVQIATYQTYSRRIKLPVSSGSDWFHDADVVIVDECTFAICPVMSKLLENYEDKPVIGLTATPMRGDGRGLGEFFDDIVSSISFSGLVDKGFLVPYRYYVPAQVDLSKIRTIAGDFDKKELGRRMDKKKLVGDIFEQWARIAGGSQTIIFAVNVKHSLHIKEKFLSKNIRCEHLDARTPQDDRARILRELDNGDIQVLTNVGILCEGFDSPSVECIVLARPTKSYGLYIQMAGRGSRICNGKQRCILIDHGGCVEMHGTLEEEMDWSLDGDKKAWSKPKKKKEDETKTLKCSFCDLVFSGGSICPECGSPVEKFGKKIEVVGADLQEFNPKKATQVDKRRFLGMLKFWIPLQKNPNPKRILGAFRGRFGVWPGPKYKNVAPIEPDQAFLNLMKSNAIRYAKRRAAQND